MKRVDIIQVIGRSYLISNIENDEFRYPKAFEALGIDFSKVQINKF